MLTLFSMPDSGNCYKPRLLMAQLKRPFRHVSTDSQTGDTRSPAYQAIAPAGKVPYLILEDGRALAESNAMLVYLAEGTRFIPEDAYERACMFQWMFFEQYSHEPNIAVRRSALIYPQARAAATTEKLASTLEGGLHALGVMEKHLSHADFLAGSTYSVADIALYAYTHVAEEGGFDLAKFPAIERWLERVRNQPGHITMQDLPEENISFADYLQMQG